MSCLLLRLDTRSAEEAEEELGEGDSTVNNVVHSFRLASTQFDKKSYLTYLKVRSQRATGEHRVAGGADFVGAFLDNRVT